MENQPTVNQPQPDQPKYDHNKMLHKLVDFLGEYLVCTEEQRIVLALWVMHTWTYRCFYKTPYLDIHSPAAQSGKTRCIELLSLLCPQKVLAPEGPTARVLAKSLLEDWDPTYVEGDDSPIRLPSVLLLDNRDFTFNVSARDPIFSLLKSGAGRYSAFLHKVPTYGMFEVGVFFPKAFAGINRLPRVLADCCIPIALQRKKREQQVRSIENASVEAKPLREWLKHWSIAYAESLSNTATVSRRNDIPVHGPQEEALWPLLYIAETMTGHDGSWATKASQSLRAIFNLQNYMRQEADSRDLLGDLCRLFHEHTKEPFIPSKDVITWLKDLDHRPWHRWGSGAPNILADLLRPYGVAPRRQRLPSGENVRVYCADDFREVWGRY